MLYNNRLFTTITTFVFAFVTSCAQHKPDEISIDKFISELESNPDLIVLDVRTDHELVGPLGKIDGCIHIEISELADRLSELEEYKDEEIAVICHSGMRSARGARILNSSGFKAQNVLGGMVAFRRNQKTEIVNDRK